MRNLITFLALAALFLGGLAARSQARPDGDVGGIGCPDTRATQVDGRVEWKGDVQRCGIGISIFGVRLSVFGPRCPDRKFIYPSHQVCAGEHNEGTWCAPAGTLEVRVEACECGSATILGTGALTPTCNCKEAGGGGHVEDAETRPC